MAMRLALRFGTVAITQLAQGSARSRAASLASHGTNMEQLRKSRTMAGPCRKPARR
ncbi:MAG: hypothetical protein Q27BB25_14535 [Blastomonas sp. CACIA14H2]|nr:MAG: hypothetical protein Q27BB25_14535 [Blastomonas sp. CACIA14H2]